MRKFLWGYALQTYPGSNCHLLPMAQQMTNSTAGRAEHRAVTAWWGLFTCYLWDSFLRGKNTELYFRVQIKFWVLDPVENVCLLVAAELEYDDLHLETFVSFIIWCYWPTAWLHNNHIKKLIFSSSSDCMSFWTPFLPFLFPSCLSFPAVTLYINCRIKLQCLH